jgi:ubiquinone/menaquinone biosynthesis C-methylase UbiE
MSPKVYGIFEDFVAKHSLKKNEGLTVLEVGAGTWTLLDIFSKNNERIAINPVISKELGARADIKSIVGSSLSLPFPDASVDVIMSCSVLEHDKYFWKSTAEIWRVLKPGGSVIVGVPCYMTLPWDFMSTTFTFKRHGYAYNADFYRFSEQSVREVILEGYEKVSLSIVRRWPNPYVVGFGTKPN